MALHTTVTHPISALQELLGAYTCGNCHTQAKDPVKCNYPVLLCQACIRSFSRTDPPQEFAPPGGFFLQEAAESHAKREAYMKAHFDRGDMKDFVIEKKADVAMILMQGLESIVKVDELQQEVEELKRKLYTAQGQLEQSKQESESTRKSGGGSRVIDMSEMHTLMDELRSFNIASQQRESDIRQQIDSQRSQLDALRQENNFQREEIAKLNQSIEDAEKCIAEKDKLLDFKNSLLEEFKDRIEQLKTESREQLVEVLGIYAEVIPVLTNMRSASKECFDAFVGKVGLADCLKAKEALKITGLCVRLAELAGPDANHKVLCKLMIGSVANNPEKLKRFEPLLLKVYEKISTSLDRGKDAARAIIAAMETEHFEESLKVFTEKSEKLKGSALCGFAISFFSGKDILSPELYALAEEKNIAESSLFLRACESFREAACSNHIEKVIALEKVWESHVRTASEEGVGRTSELIALMLHGKNTQVEIVQMLTAFIPLLSQQNSEVIADLLVALRRIPIADIRASLASGVVKWLLEATRVRADLSIGKELLKQLSLAESNSLLSSADVVGQMVDHGLEFEKSCELNQLLKLKAQASSVSEFIAYFKLLLDQRHALSSSGSEWIRLCFACIGFDKYQIAFLAAKIFVSMIRLKGKVQDAEEFSKYILETVGLTGPFKEIDVIQSERTLLSLGEIIVKVQAILQEVQLLPFIKAILKQMQEKDYDGANELTRETLELLADEGRRHILVAKLLCRYPEKDSVSILRNFWKVLKSLNNQLQSTLEKMIDALDSTTERIVQVFFAIVTSDSLAMQGLDEVFVMMERASKCTMQERTCFMEMLNETKLKQSLFVANNLLMLKEVFLARGVEDPVLTDERAEEFKQTIKKATKSKEEMEDSLSGVIDLAAQFLDPIQYYKCTPNHIIDFVRHVLSHAFSNPYPLQLLTNLRDPRVFASFKQFLAKQISPVPAQKLFSFVAGGIVYVEPGRMKYFNFQTLQWNAWIALQSQLKVSAHSEYSFLEDDKLFCCGGWSGSVCYNNTYLITLTGETRELATLNTTRCHHGLVYLAYRRTVYTFGGNYGSGGVKTGEKFDLNQLQKDTDKGAWVGLRSDMTEVRIQFNPCLFNGLVYLCGSNSATMDVFDPERETMTRCADNMQNGPSVLFEDRDEDGDKLVVISGNFIKKFRKDQQGFLLASSNNRTGECPWQSNFPVIFEDKVYASQSGRCIWLDRKTGSFKDQRQ